MKFILFAFIISLSLHFLFFTSYENKKILEENSKKTKEIKKKSSVKYVQIKKEKKPTQNLSKEPTKKTKKKLVKQKPKNKAKKQKKYIKVKTPVKYQKKRNFKKAKEFQKKVLKKQIVKEKNSIQEKTLEEFLSQKTPIDKKVLSQIERLYGREFESFTKVQKAFIKKNLNQFQTITQRVLNRLGYPKLAAKLRIGGKNIVEFTFHPNGDISNLKITSSSSYPVLDDYTIKLIQIAYKDYPRPKTPTKLKFNVHYRLY